MVKSMTGYGRSELSLEKLKVSVEIKSVNNRYLDIVLRMPRQLNPLEARIRNVLKKYMKRGKVDVYISYEDLTQENRSVKYNSIIAGEYYRYLKQMTQEYHLKDDIGAGLLSKFPDVFTLEEETPDENKIWDNLEEQLEKAAEEFALTREREGEFLRRDLTAKLDEMLENVAFIETRAPVLLENYRKRLTDKVRELLEEKAIDDSRIVQEVAIYADKICVDEELVRLHSHIQAVRDILSEDKAAGRKLDFIVQEMNREANTTLSKSDVKEVTDIGIDLKTLIEKVREQVQNIE